MGNKTQSSGDGEPTHALSRLIDELGITADDWRQWLRDFGADVVTSALVAFDWDTLPFVGEGS